MTHDIISLFDAVDLSTLTPYARLQREEHLWGALCQTLDALSGSERERACQDAQDILHAIRPELRRAPRAWLEARLGSKDPDPRLGLVRHIRLTHTALSPEALGHLAGAPELSATTMLRLDDAQISSQGLEALLTSTWSLRELWLGRNQIDDAGAAALAASPLLEGVTSLGLADNQIGDEGAIALVSSPHVLHLRELYLPGNKLSDPTILAIAHGRALATLERLYLYANPGITDAGAQALLPRLEHHFPCLQDLDLSDTGVSPSLAHTLATSCPARP